MDRELRMEIGENIITLFSKNDFLLKESYRITKTKNRNLSKPIRSFRDYYIKTKETEFSRDTIEKKILLTKSGKEFAGKDPIGTGIRTMQDFSFLDKNGDNYILTYQFFEWVESGIDFNQFVADQLLEIRSVYEIKSIYNAYLCVFSEWIKNGAILDFSGITDDAFVKKIRNKRKRKKYCKFVYENYGFAGDIRKGALPSEGNYCPDVLQRFRTLLLNSNLIQRIDDNEDGIKQYDLSEKGINLLREVNRNIGIIISGEDINQCHGIMVVNEDVNDAPRVKRFIRTGEKCSDKSEKETTSKGIKDKAKKHAGYICELEIDCAPGERNKLFIERSTNQNYVEGHHLIPMEYAKKFKFSLDVEANIVCLCPSCHRKLHHGLDDERKDLIKKIYEKREERLELCKLNQTKDGDPFDVNSLYKLYKIG